AEDLRLTSRRMGWRTPTSWLPQRCGCAHRGLASIRSTGPRTSDTPELLASEPIMHSEHYRSKPIRRSCSRQFPNRRRFAEDIEAMREYLSPVLYRSYG